MIVKKTENDPTEKELEIAFNRSKWWRGGYCIECGGRAPVTKSEPKCKECNENHPC